MVEPNPEPNPPCFVLHRLRGCWYSDKAKTCLDDIFGEKYTDIEYTDKTRAAADKLYKDKWSSWPKVTFVDKSNHEIIIGGYDDLVNLTKSILKIFSKDAIEPSDIDNAISSIMVVRQNADQIHYEGLVHLAKAIIRQKMDK